MIALKRQSKDEWGFLPRQSDLHNDEWPFTFVALQLLSLKLRKMKRIFGLMMVFAFAVCMAMPTVNASVFDDDVGLTIDHGVTLTQGVVLTDIPEIATLAIAHPMILQNRCLLSDFESKANECLNAKPTLNSFWHGGDSKASLCKATGGIDTAFYNDTTALRYAHLRLWPPRS